MHQKLRLTAAALVLALGIVGFAVVLNSQYPIWRWLVWRYVAEWLLAMGWATGCVSLGHVVVRKALALRFPLREHLVLSFAVGVVGFGIGLFCVGIAGGLGTVFFFGWPLILLVSTGPALFAYLKERWVRLRSLKRNASTSSPWIRFATAFGVVGIAIVMLSVMTAQNVAFDSHWYHAAVAESYAATGRIMRFREGWFLGTLPQLATWLYTWAFLCPASSLAFHLELAAHVELVIFLFTLASVPVVVRWLTKGQASRATWVVFFLFPGIFVYDSNLNLSADHVLAFWALPLVMVARRLFPVMASRPSHTKLSVLLGIVLSGALLTKYQVLYVVVGLSVWLAAVCIASLLSAGSTLRVPLLRATLGQLLVSGIVVVVLTTPHWLKNLLWHRNPVYPFARNIFGGTPWVPGIRLRLLDGGWSPEGTWWERVWETALATFTFSFVPHDWPDFHKEWPVFGSLFTLLFLPLLLVAPSRRIGGFVAASFAAVGTWYWTYHQDRYLQSLVPWFVAITAAAIVTLWNTRSRPVQLGVLLLVGLQVIWSGDLPFLPTHAMTGRSSVAVAMERVSTGYREEWSEREDPGTGLPKIRRMLPEGAVPLLHEEHQRLGLGRWVVSDSFGRQGGIRYRNWDTRRNAFDALRELGVTHILSHEEPTGDFSVADNIVLFDLLRVLPFKGERETYGIYELSNSASIDQPSLTGAVVVSCRGLRTVRVMRDVDDAVRKFSEGPCQPDLSRLPFVVANVRFVVMPTRLFNSAPTLPGPWKELFRQDDTLVFHRSE